MTKTKTLIISVVALIILIILAISFLLNPKVVGNTATIGLNSQTINDQTDTNNISPIQEVATDLSIPWDIAFLPDETILVTQRPGSILHIKPDAQLSIKVQGVEHTGEGGLLGLVLDPDYQINNYIYLYLTTKNENGLTNRVERYTFNETNNSLSNKKIILENIPGASYHDGGRLAFGPDGYLYITTGDAGDSNLAQDINSLAGKVLRITKDGDIPEDNPFNNEVFSFGHRNPQGLAWDSNANLWETEHGPSVVTTGLDEVNLIEKGKNYGWPDITGNQTGEGMIAPKLQSGSQTTWAPASLAIFNDTLFFAGLKGEGLYTAKIENNNLTNFKKHFSNEFGRLRTVVIDPNNEWLYLTTSNTDGRGKANQNDDKIIKIRLDLILE